MTLTQEKVPKIVQSVVKHKLKTSYVGELYGISQRRVQQLVKEYRETGEYPIIQKVGRKPNSNYPSDIREQIKRAKKKLHGGTVVVAKYLRKKRGIKIGNDAVHKILLEENMTKEDKRKKGRKKPWIRYERKHSLSAVHMDWHENEKKEQICAVTDDSSRMILSIGEYPSISTENSIDLLQRAQQKYEHIRKIREVITDHGSEFYANKRDKKGNAKHKFEMFCKDNEIKQILCSVKHPQTNGKLEKFFDIYDKNRWEFNTLDEFVYWYNCIRPHMSLDFDNLQTPKQAFYDRLDDVILGNFMKLIEKNDVVDLREDFEVKS